MSDFPSLILAILPGAGSPPMQISEIQWRLSLYNTAATPRQIKAAVRDLRRRGHVIVSRRAAPYGYYIDQTPEGGIAAGESLSRQAISMLKTAALMLPKGRVLEMLGQEGLWEAR